MPDSRPIRAALAAVAFLTRIPVPGAAKLDGTDVANGAPLFPLVGAGLGAVSGLAAIGADRIGLAPWLAAVIAVATGVLLTGALHLDGLADSCDALGGHSRERRLEIMRDHAIGTYGALALILVLVARIGAIEVIVTGASTVALLAAAGAVSRAVPLALAAALPYANRDPGSGSSVVRSTSIARAAVANAIGVALAIILVGTDALWLIGLAGLVTLIVGVHARSRLGGVTGDTLGATSELSETTGLVLLSALG